MNMDWLKPLLDALQLKPLHMATIAVVCAVLLFGPADVLQALGVAQLAQDYRAWLGAGLLAGAAALAAQAALPIARALRERLQQRRVRQYLLGATEHEQQILRGYMAQQTRTQLLYVGDGVVRGLEAAGVLRRASEVGDRDMNYAFNLTAAAWAVLQHDDAVARALGLGSPRQ